MADGSLSQFKAFLARKIERNQKRQRNFDKKLKYKSSDTKTEFNFPKYSEFELEKVKSEIRNDLLSDKKKEFISFAVISFLIIILILILLFI